MCTVERKVQCVLWLAKFESVTKVQREYHRVYNEAPPHRNNINRWDKQLKDTGSLLDKPRSGRPSLSDESVEAIRESYLRNPKKSVRACARQLHLSKTTVHKVLKKRLRFKDRCENSKELLDLANVRKRGIGRDEESIGETMNCEGNHCELQLKEEDLNTPLEKDPLDLTEDERPIKSEIEDIVISSEMPPNVAIESSNGTCIPGENKDEDPVMAMENGTSHLPSSLSLTALDCNERISKSVGESVNCEGNHSGLQLKEEDLNVELEEDPLYLTEDERPIKSEIEDIVISNEIPPNLAIESSNNPCFPGKNEDEDPVMVLEADRIHIPSNLSLTESDCIETIPMESYLSPPCTIIGDSLIPSEDEMELQEEEERDPLGDLTDVKPSVSQLNGAFTEVKEEPCGEGSNHECVGKVSLLSRMQGSDNTCQVTEDSFIPSGGHDLGVSTDELRSTDNGNNDPLDMTSLTFTLKKEECEVRLNATSSHDKPRESAQKNVTEQRNASYVQSDAGKIANRTSDLRALRPRRHMTRKEVNGTGGNAKNGGQVETEMQTRGTLQHNFEGTNNKLRCNSCGMWFAAESNLRKHIESHSGEQMSKSEIYSGKEFVGRDSLVCADESIDVKSVLNLKSMSLCKEWTCNVCQKVFKGDGHLRLQAGETTFKCDECDRGFNHRKNQTPPNKIHSGDTYKCEECGKEFANKDNLNRHLEIHAEERPFKCDTCNKRFKRKKYQIAHSKLHTGDTYKCQQCGKLFVTKEHLKTHLRVHTGERPYKCDICDKGFKQRFHLLAHSTIHSGDKPHKCNECGKGFIELARLKCHLRLHTGEKPFKCDVCNKQFKHKWILTDHSRIHTGDTYNCEQCGKRFTRISNFKIHLQLHTGGKPFNCDICHKQFSSHLYLIRHSKLHAGCTYKCEQCGNGFATSRHLQVHLRVHTGERPFKCDVCEKRFIQRTHLRAHSMIHSKEKPYNCNECGKGFIELARLKCHLRLHTGERPFKCDICNKGFTDRRCLRAHSKFHSGETYNCDQCGKAFITRNLLSQHIQLHTGEKPFKCDICHKQFSNRRYLLCHLKIHSDCTYKCEQCGKWFPTRSNLNIHLRIHTKERPFKCDICDKRFKQKSTLLVHSKIHNSDKPYKCNVCGKGFIVNSKLIDHLRIHTGERPFKCDICNKGFTGKGILTAHSKIHSGDTYKCEQCGKVYITRSQLNRHVQTHTTKRPFKCDICHKQFKLRCQLFAHSKFHSNDQPYKCNECGYGFIEKSVLKGHLRRHTAVRPFICDICSKGFTRKSSLIFHSKIHSGDT